MTQQSKDKIPTELGELRQVAVNLEQHEAEWSIMRADLRALAVKAVLDDGFSVAKAAEIAGVQRKTLSVWLDIERQVRKRTEK